MIVSSLSLSVAFLIRSSGISQPSWICYSGTSFLRLGPGQLAFIGFYPITTVGPRQGGSKTQVTFFKRRLKNYFTSLFNLCQCIELHCFVSSSVWIIKNCDSVFQNPAQFRNWHPYQRLFHFPRSFHCAQERDDVVFQTPCYPSESSLTSLPKVVRTVHFNMSSALCICFCICIWIVFVFVFDFVFEFAFVFVFVLVFETLSMLDVCFAEHVHFQILWTAAYNLIQLLMQIL